MSIYLIQVANIISDINCYMLITLYVHHCRGRVFSKDEIQLLKLLYFQSKNLLERENDEG